MMRYKDKGKQYAFNAWTARDQEITKLKKALELANNALSHIETHGRTDRGHYSVKYASEAQKQIKEVLEGK